MITVLFLMGTLNLLQWNITLYSAFNATKGDFFTFNINLKTRFKL